MFKRKLSLGLQNLENELFKFLLIACKSYNAHVFSSLITLIFIQINANKKAAIREKIVDSQFKLHEKDIKTNKELTEKIEKKTEDVVEDVKNIEMNVSHIKRDVSEIKIKLDEKYINHVSERDEKKVRVAKG